MAINRDSADGLILAAERHNMRSHAERGNEIRVGTR
jgi:hypothetical protein